MELHEEGVYIDVHNRCLTFDGQLCKTSQFLFQNCFFSDVVSFWTLNKNFFRAEEDRGCYMCPWGLKSGGLELWICGGDKSVTNVAVHKWNSCWSDWKDDFLSPYAPTSTQVCFPLCKAICVRALAVWQKHKRHNSLSQCSCAGLVHLILWNYVNLISHSNCYQRWFFILFDVLLHAKILVFSLPKELWNFLEFQVVPFQSSTVQAVERTNPYFFDNPSTYADSWLTQFLRISKLLWFVRKAFVVLWV